MAKDRLTARERLFITDERIRTQELQLKFFEERAANQFWVQQELASHREQIEKLQAEADDIQTAFLNAADTRVRMTAKIAELKRQRVLLANEKAIEELKKLTVEVNREG